MPDVEAQPRDLLLRFLADRDEPCPVCSYNLRGAPNAHCPECGTPLELRVGSPEARVGPWLVALVPSVAALGFHGLILFIGLGRWFWATFVDPGMYWSSSDERMLIMFSWPTVLLGAVVGTLLVRRRKAWRLPRGTQWLRAAITAGFTLILLGVTLGLLFAQR